jgi:SAM-dependent methyltransferase
VLDLGCGSGELLAHLQQHKGCTGYGIEIADANVQACVQRGVNVIQLNLEDGPGAVRRRQLRRRAAARHAAAPAQHREDAARDGARGPHRHRQLPELRALAQPAARAARAACR